MKNIIFNAGSIEEILTEREGVEVIASLQKKFNTENVDFWQCEPGFREGIFLITPEQEEDFREDFKGCNMELDPHYCKNGNTAGLPYFAVEVKP